MWMSLAAPPGRALRAEQVEHRTQDQADAAFIDAWKQQRRRGRDPPDHPRRIVVVKFNDWMCPGCRAAKVRPLLKCSHPVLL